MGRARSLGAVAAATVLAALHWVPPAAAQTSTSLDAQRGALALAREASALVALGGFGQPASPRIAAAVSSLGLAGNDPNGTLTAADAEGQAILPAIPNATPDVQRTLARLSDADRQAAGDGRTISVSVEEYLRGLEHLLRYNGGPPPAPAPPDPGAINAQLRQLLTNPPPAAPTGPSTPLPPATNLPAGLQTTITSVTQTAGDISEDSTPSALALVVGGLLVVVLIGVNVLVIRRRRGTGGGPPVTTRPPASSTATTDTSRPGVNAAMQTLLEVSRRLTSEAASGDVDRAVVRHALEVVRAQGAALVRQSQANHELVVSTETQPGLLVPEGLAVGAVRRVAETGQSLIQVSATEPAISNLPAALAAVPLVGGGRVEAVLILVRPDSEPFTAAEREVLLAFAPVAAAALTNARQARAAIEESQIDPLTGVGNRRRFDLDLTRALRDGAPTALFMVDLDHFKRVNDEHGHPAGDALLKGVTKLLSEAVRPGDTVYRFGGEEFCVLLLRTRVDEAAEVAERVRQKLEERRFAIGKPDPLRATASFGVAGCTDDDGEGLVARADEALYVAKQSGRNRVASR